MKLAINKHVRETISTELLRACDRLDAAHKSDLTFDESIELKNARAAVVAAACRIISHATEGRRYPLMTQRTWGEKKRRDQ